MCGSSKPPVVVFVAGGGAALPSSFNSAAGAAVPILKLYRLKNSTCKLLATLSAG
jgi:hypothetical protein